MDKERGVEKSALCSKTRVERDGIHLRCISAS